MAKVLVFGTYRLKDATLRNMLREAWAQGIRHFDTAQLYRNEDVVGEVIQELATEADPAMITTKYWDSGVSSMDSITSKIKGSLTRLRGEVSPNAIALRVLLHHPAGPHAWKVFEDLSTSIDSLEIGVCNHSVSALRTLLSYATIRPCVNQTEVHPKLPPGELHDLSTYCRAEHIPIEAHSVMIRGLYFDEIGQICAPFTAPEYLLKFALLHPGVVRACVSTSNQRHLIELVSLSKALAMYDLDDRYLRLYPLQTVAGTLEHHQRAATGYNDARVIARQIRTDMAAFTGGGEDKKPAVSDVIYYLPSVKSKHSALGRDVAKICYGDQTDTDVACYAKFHALTKPLRKYVTDRVIAATEERRLAAKSANGSVCCVRKKADDKEVKDEISDAIVNPVPMPVEIAPRDYLTPFFTHLRRNEPWTGDKEFFRGALFEDGRMDLCKQVVGPTHIEELCASVSGNSHIKHFLLGNNIAFDRHPERAKAMAELMRDNSLQIETWYLAGNCINPEAILVLCEALMGNTVAKALWLKRNPIGPRGAVALSGLLSTNQTLSILDLDNCGLLDEGIRVLSQARGCKLKHLYIDANGITPVGARYLAEFITAHRDTLKGLYASINRLGDEGAKSITDAFRGSTSLKRLSLGSNRITDASADAIVDCALSCPKLVLLDVGCYKSTFDMGEKPNFFVSPEPWLRLIANCPRLQHLDLLRNAMTVDDAHRIVRAAKERTERADPLLAPINVYASMNNVLRDQLSYVEGIPDKAQQKVLKHPKRVVHIDSMYRNKMA